MFPLNKLSLEPVLPWPTGGEGALCHPADTRRAWTPMDGLPPRTLGPAWVLKDHSIGVLCCFARKIDGDSWFT